MIPIFLVNSPILFSKILFKESQPAIPEVTYLCCSCKLSRFDFSSKELCLASFSRRLSIDNHKTIPPAKTRIVKIKASAYFFTLIVLAMIYIPVKVKISQHSRRSLPIILPSAGIAESYSNPHRADKNRVDGQI